MGVDGDVAACTNQVFTCSEGDVVATFGVDNKATQPEVNQMNCVGKSPDSHHDVVGLQIPVDVETFVHGLDQLKQLVEEHQGGLDAELASAKVKQIFQTGAH